MSASKFPSFEILNITWNCPRAEFLRMRVHNDQELQAHRYLKTFCKDGKTWRDTLTTEVISFATLRIGWDCPRADFLRMNLFSPEQLQAYNYLRSFCKDGKTWRDTLSKKDFSFEPIPTRPLKKYQSNSYEIPATQIRRSRHLSRTRQALPESSAKAGATAATAIDLTIDENDMTSDASDSHLQRQNIRRSERMKAKDCEVAESKLRLAEEENARLEQRCQDLERHCSCKICLKIPDGRRALCTPCGHAFCSDCLDAWRNDSSTCPVCRTKILPANILYFYF